MACGDATDIVVSRLMILTSRWWTVHLLTAAPAHQNIVDPERPITLGNQVDAEAHPFCSTASRPFCVRGATRKREDKGFQSVVEAKSSRALGRLAQDRRHPREM